MGIFLSLAGKLAGEGIMAGANFAKQKLDESKAAENARLKKIHMGEAYRLPEGFCEGADGHVWRVIDVDGKRFCLRRKYSGGAYVEWFKYDVIKDYYEDV